MRMMLALLAGAVAWMAVVAAQTPAVRGPAPGSRRSGFSPLPGHYNRLASYYRIHLN